MSRKIAMYSILAFVLSLVFCGSFLSSDTYAAMSRLGNYYNYTSNFQTSSGSTLSSSLAQNAQHFIGKPSNTAYIANGHFATQQTLSKDKHYSVVLYTSIQYSTSTVMNPPYVLPEAIAISSGSNVYTSHDDIEVSSTCYGPNNSNSGVYPECIVMVIHTIDLVVNNNGTYELWTPSSNLLAFNGPTGTMVYFSFSASIFDSSDEALSFRNGVLSRLDDLKGYVDNIEGQLNVINSNIDDTQGQLNVIGNYIDGVEGQLNVINSNIDDTQGQLNVINNSIAGTNTKLDTANNLQSQANQDANDRYDDEKQTISDNADGGIDSVNNIDTSFTLPNIFGIILGDLSVQTCYSIPTLASFVHSTNTQYCAWFPSSVRTAMSALVDVIVLFIVCSFIWSWVKKGGL